MGAAIGDVLGLAAGVAVSPLPIVAIVLLLATPAAGPTAPCSPSAGWSACPSWARSSAPGRPDRPRTTGSPPPGPAGSSSSWACCCCCWRRGRAGPPGRGPSRRCPSGWPVSTGCDPARRWAWGAAVGGQPQERGLTIAAAASIAGAGLAGGQQAVALAVFVLIGSLGVLAPLVLYLVAGERAARTLDSWKTWPATTTRPSWPCCSWSSASSWSATASPCCSDRLGQRSWSWRARLTASQRRLVSAMDALDVGLHGVEGDEQLVGDLARRQGAGQVAQHHLPTR